MPYPDGWQHIPMLGKGLQYNEIRILIQIFKEGRCLGEVIVCLVQYHQPIKPANQRFNFATEQVIAGRIVGRADKNQFGMLIRSSQKLVGRELEILIEQHFTVLHIINVSTDLIHAVGRVDGHYIVHTGFTKSTEHQIDSFITAIP